MGIYTSTYLKNIVSERSMVFERKLFSAQNEDKSYYDKIGISSINLTDFNEVKSNFFKNYSFS